ncbi:PadR family transcriptional regulator [Nocardiopsis salina]|uniref:PadR family transcriptional regulator n=1 Tax=Nocardiopsis salina TaxID=245836 RepID=UPI0003490306|nr:PadR family transcriptional regulator [Nocardiopsis salina]
MSTIFGHGRLRLYLLKMLDESPRHGYEIISLLRDRFLGVYSPSPGTIYPRLARLEEEGLVTHTEEGGRKVYRLTDKGREELRERESDLDDLEQEITDSVRDIARAVKQDVRATISSLREELKFSQARREEGTTDAPEPDGEAGSEDRGSERQGPSLTEEWVRFTRSFSNLGSSWRGSQERGKPSGGEQAAEPDQRSDGEPESSGGHAFDRELRDFSDRVRDVVREAGSVGGAAAGDLRRILDETVEVIRKDVRSWGPPRSGSEGAEPEPETAREDRPGDPPPSDGDPWGAAVDEDGESTERE